MFDLFKSNTPIEIEFRPKTRVINEPKYMVYTRPKYEDSNVPLWVDKYLSNPSHLLIGGSTGCGKSTAETTIFYYSLLKSKAYYYFIDVKRVELFPYRNMATCKEYANTRADSIRLMNSLLFEMESRYDRMANKGLKTSDEPVIYLFIDEVADLLQNDPKKEFLKKLLKLSQLGRASNIFIICCTQDTTKSLLGTTKNNFNYKLGLHTTTDVESRNMIGVKGCEELTRGHGLFLSDTIESVDIPKIEDASIKEIIIGL